MNSRRPRLIERAAPGTSEVQKQQSACQDKRAFWLLLVCFSNVTSTYDPHLSSNHHSLPFCHHLPQEHSLTILTSVIDSATASDQTQSPAAPLQSWPSATSPSIAVQTSRQRAHSSPTSSAAAAKSSKLRSASRREKRILRRDAVLVIVATALLEHRSVPLPTATMKAPTQSHRYVHQSRCKSQA